MKMWLKVKRSAWLSILCLLTMLCVGFGMRSVHNGGLLEISAENAPVFEMEKGASIKKVQGEFGIRWENKVNKDYIDALIGKYGEDAQVEFRSLVGPAVDNINTLTVDYATANGYSDIPCLAGKLSELTYDASDNCGFYTAILYSKLSAEQQKQAFAVDLTARTYVKVNGAFVGYALAEDTTRSMKSIASYILLNDIDTANKTVYEQYAGALNATEELGEEICGYYSELDEKGAVSVELPKGNYTAYIGAKKVANNIVGNGESVDVTLSKAPLKIGDDLISAGEEYDVTFISSEGSVYTQPFFYATKTIDEASDLDCFQFSAPTDMIDGYYILTKHIDIPANYTYSHKVNGKFDLKTNGFCGTFDGNGYTIDGLKITATNGLFGILYNATIKNVAFTNAGLSADGYAAFLAGITVNATIDNVYVDMLYTLQSGTWSGAIVYSMDYKTKISNCIFNVEVNNTGTPYYYGSVGGQSVSGLIPEFENVYVISELELFHGGSSQTPTDDLEGVTRYATMNDVPENSTYTFDETLWDTTKGNIPVWRKQKAVVNLGTVKYSQFDKALDANIDAYKNLEWTSSDGYSMRYNNGYVISKDGTENFVADGETVVFNAVTDTARCTLTVNVYTRVIDNVTDLDCFKMNTATDTIDGYYILSRNIVADNYTYAHNVELAPQGYFSVAPDKGYGFVGTFDGNGYKIDGLNITATNGLFGHVEGATIKNVAFTNAVVDAGGFGGLLAGSMRSGTVENVYIDMDYTVKSAWSGAVAYQIRSGVMFENCVIDVCYKTGLSSHYGAISGLADSTIHYIPLFENTYVISNIVLIGNKAYKRDAMNCTLAEGVTGAIYEKGVKRYENLGGMEADKSNNNFDSFKTNPASTYWTVNENGTLTFNAKPDNQ